MALRDIRIANAFAIPVAILRTALHPAVGAHKTLGAAALPLAEIAAALPMAVIGASFELTLLAEIKPRTLTLASLRVTLAIFGALPRAFFLTTTPPSVAIAGAFAIGGVAATLARAWDHDIGVLDGGPWACTFTAVG